MSLSYITKYFPTLIVLLFITQTASGQSVNWKTDRSKKGPTDIKYSFEKVDGEKVLRYEAETTTDVDLASIRSFIAHIPNHMLYLEHTPQAKLIAKGDDNTIIAYYFVDPPWPIKKSDNVVTFHFEDRPNGFSFIGHATPDAYPIQDVNRTMDYRIAYHFDEQADGSVAVRLVSHFLPPGAIPNYLLKKWFPDGPAEMLQGLFEHAAKAE